MAATTMTACPMLTIVPLASISSSEITISVVASPDIAPLAMSHATAGKSRHHTTATGIHLTSPKASIRGTHHMMSHHPTVVVDLTTQHTPTTVASRWHVRQLQPCCVCRSFVHTLLYSTDKHVC